MSNEKDKIDKIEISNATREFIVDKLVEPYYKNMIKTTISGKKMWRTIGISFETASKVMVALGGIFSFSAGVYRSETLSFVSGSISCMSLALLQIASFSYKENKKQGDELNILLKKLKLDTIPSMPRSEDQSTMSQARESAFRSTYTGPYGRQHNSIRGPGPSANAIGPNANAIGANAIGANAIGPNANVIGANAIGPNVIASSIRRSYSPPHNNIQQHVYFADEPRYDEPRHDEYINMPMKDLIELTEQFRQQEEQILAMSKELMIAKNDIDKGEYVL
jgi:hypothetical protein